MQTKIKELEIADDIQHLENWLKSEYPHGLELYYVDRGDSLDDSTEIIMEIVREGYSEKLSDSMMDYDLSYTFDEIEKNYIDSLEDIDELSEEIKDYIREWCHEHDTSDYQKDILRNTSAQLFFIDTGVEVHENNENVSEIIKKFGKKDEKKTAAIQWIGNEQFYHSTIQFYFHADVQDMVKALHKDDGDYIAIDGAMIANVTRGNGSNWVHHDNIFQLVIPKKAFIANVYGDKEKGTGYGWHSICGGWNCDTCGVFSSKTKNMKGYSYIEGETSLDALKEREYEKTWNNGKGSCTFLDMNISRHKDAPYKNEVPCGNTCAKCGTFWID